MWSKQEPHAGVTPTVLLLSVRQTAGGRVMVGVAREARVGGVT